MREGLAARNGRMSTKRGWVREREEGPLMTQRLELHPNVMAEVLAAVGLAGGVRSGRAQRWRFDRYRGRRARSDQMCWRSDAQILG